MAKKKKKEPGPLRRLALLCEWDGTDYAGWQFQENALTLQEVLEKALSTLCCEPIRVTGSSRTDAGVHARGHVCHFDTQATIPAERYPAALNSLLPETVAVRAAAEVGPDFHARFGAVGKQYSYYLYTGPQRSALWGRYSYREKRPLNREAMQELVRVLVGKHDFRAFMASGGQVKSTVRTLYAVELEDLGERLRFVVRGDGFLYNMVRILAGTLVYVGLGKLTVAEVCRAMELGDRRLVGKTLPARGLFLDRVMYDPEVFPPAPGAQTEGERS